MWCAVQRILDAARHRQVGHHGHNRVGAVEASGAFYCSVGHCSEVYSRHRHLPLMMITHMRADHGANDSGSWRNTTSCVEQVRETLAREGIEPYSFDPACIRAMEQQVR